MNLNQVQVAACNFRNKIDQNSSIKDVINLEPSELDEPQITDNLELGRISAIKKEEFIKEIVLEGNPEILFVIAAMGRCSGTGAAPEVSRIAKEFGILTIGIVAEPFLMETDNMFAVAEAGIASLKQYTDTTIVLSPYKLNQLNEDLGVVNNFRKIDDYVFNAIRAIADIVTITSEVNVDVYDVRTVMEGAKRTTIGNGTGAGKERAMLAAREALTTALSGNDISWAEKVLLSIISGPEAELDMEELVEITDFIQNNAGDDSEIIFGHGVDEDLKNMVRVTFIASNFLDS